jgi:hypothetical protein
MGSQPAQGDAESRRARLPLNEHLLTRAEAFATTAMT